MCMCVCHVCSGSEEEDVCRAIGRIEKTTRKGDPLSMFVELNLFILTILATAAIRSLRPSSSSFTVSIRFSTFVSNTAPWGLPANLVAAYFHVLLANSKFWKGGEGGGIGQHGGMR